MLITIIITVLTCAGAICGVWGLGENDGICKYDNIGEENEK